MSLVRLPLGELGVDVGLELDRLTPPYLAARSRARCRGYFPFRAWHTGCPVRCQGDGIPEPASPGFMMPTFRRLFGPKSV